MNHIEQFNKFKPLLNDFIAILKKDESFKQHACTEEDIDIHLITDRFEDEDVVKERGDSNCCHEYKLHCHGLRKTETYICVKCGHLMYHRWYN
jgi:hypothetical protein